MKVRAGLVSAAAVCAPLVVAEEQEAAKELVCINDETQWRTGYNFRRKPQSFAIVWRKLVTKLLLNSDPSQFSSNDVAESAVSTSRHRVAKSTMSTCLSTGNAGCMVLEVHHPSASACAVADSVYELFEPVHLELGEKVQHVVDYAYSPVANTALVRESIHVHTSNSNAETHLQEDSSVGIEESARGGWWQWWIPWKMLRERNKSAYGSKYSIHEEAFAGGSHGEVWRGRRKCNKKDKGCHDDPLIFKRLKIETGFRTLEAGLREVYFGNLLQQGPQRVFTQYVEHFFGEAGELWIVFRDAGPSLRSLLYTGTDTGDFVVYQSSWLWTLIRKSLLAKQNDVIEKTDEHPVVALLDAKEDARGYQQEDGRIGRQLISTFLRQILEAAKTLHENGIIHRDIKPANVMCESNLDLEHLQSLAAGAPHVHCVLGDFSSAFNDFTSHNLYTRGPSRLEQTDEYAPPEAIFGLSYNDSSVGLSPSFDSWSIGIVALELLLGTPNVFSVDQRTRMVLSHKMQKQGATAEEIEKAIYLAALSQFCIYNPSKQNKRDWPLRDGDPLHRTAMTKQSCNLDDFHRALRARDPLGWGFSATDTLLHLIWQLLAWDPNKRMTASDALKHPYFAKLDVSDKESDPTPGDHNALESQMLDPRMDFNLSDSIDEFMCPKCGRVFTDWKSCHAHANARRHSKFCRYDHRSLPTCLNSHAMLPAHSYSGYCDIQGRRRTIEDFHAIHLLPSQQFYGIFDGHLGNFASKYAASFLYGELSSRLAEVTSTELSVDWKEKVEKLANDAFAAVHKKFLEAITRAPRGFMDQSGTTATSLLVTNSTFVITSLGDSRAVMSSRRIVRDGGFELMSVQLTKDHVASDRDEREQVERRGGIVIRRNGMDRVNGTLAITRSIGDTDLSPMLSREPHVICMTRKEIIEACGDIGDDKTYPCFMILASDGLWDTVSNQEAVDLVAQVVAEVAKDSADWHETAGLQQAAEALTHEAYVRGSTDNIGVCIIGID